MDLNKFMEQYAKEVNGKYSEYDDSKSIVVVPIGEGRYQTIIGNKHANNVYERPLIEISSKICQYEPSIDLSELLRHNTRFCHAKFSIVDDYLRVEASSFVDTVNEEYLREMISEVAEAADDWERKITGIDVH